MMHNPILPGTGRWQAAGLTEGFPLTAKAAPNESWDPSAPSGHLPVPGRIV
jgi:hypothetical protein